MTEKFNHRVIELFDKIHCLDRIQRAGWVIRGVTEAESVAAHSHFLALLTLLFTEEFPGRWDSSKALAMALVHDLPEAVLMDIPAPASEAFLKEAKAKAENSIFRGLFEGLPEKLSACFQEYQEQKSPEARLVAALDKMQMMLKLGFYQKEGRGRLEEFWANPNNFKDYGITEVRQLFETLAREMGRKLPE
ncbi:MAG: HD domain-containing protein [Spirochaetales bacterium]|nr:HD domain-containing protein [Spirochaetales bacterium]